MRTAIMQPYLFPYIGYFQLMSAVDLFIFYDNAQYMKGGWINRNQIYVNDQAKWITLPVQNDSMRLSINQRRYVLDETSTTKLLNQFDASYASYRYYRDTRELIAEILSYSSDNVAQFNEHSLRRIAEALNISCRFETASSISLSEGLRGQDKVIALCKSVDAQTYINPIGGIDLYRSSAFSNAGIKLMFLETLADMTKAGGAARHLSIIHKLASRGINGTREELHQFTLKEPGSTYSTDEQP